MVGADGPGKFWIFHLADWLKTIPIYRLFHSFKKWSSYPRGSTWFTSWRVCPKRGSKVGPLQRPILANFRTILAVFGTLRGTKISKFLLSFENFHGFWHFPTLRETEFLFLWFNRPLQRLVKREKGTLIARTYPSTFLPKYPPGVLILQNIGIGVTFKILFSFV